MTAPKGCITLTGKSPCTARNCTYPFCEAFPPKKKKAKLNG